MPVSSDVISSCIHVQAAARVRLAATSCCIVLECSSRGLRLPMAVEPTIGDEGEKEVVFSLEKNCDWKKSPRGTTMPLRPLSR